MSKRYLGMLVKKASCLGESIHNTLQAPQYASQLGETNLSAKLSSHNFREQVSQKYSNRAQILLKATAMKNECLSRGFGEQRSHYKLDMAVCVMF